MPVPKIHARKWIDHSMQRKFALGAFVILSIVALSAFFPANTEREVLKEAGYVLGTTSDQSEWEAGEFYPGTIDTTSSPGDITIAAGQVGTWDAETMAYPTDTRGYYNYTYEGANYGADIITDGYYLYLIFGGRQPELFRYNPELNTWKQMADAPTGFYYGSSMAYYDGNIYAINGQDGNDSTDARADLFRYNLKDDEWSQLSDAPDNWGLGSDIVSNGAGTIYAARGRSTDAFWSYDIASDTWDDTLPSVISPYQIYTTTGHALLYSDVSYGSDPVQCESGCIYAFRGGSQRQFFRFDIQFSQWYSGFADVPTALGSSGRINYGSSMALDDVNGNIYAMTGYNQDEFMMYDIDTETWDADTADTPDLSFTVDEGGSLAYLNGYVYAIPGINRPEILRYDVNNSTWNNISLPATTSAYNDGDLIEFVPNGADCADPDGCLFAPRGRNTNTFYRYDISTRTWNTLATVPSTLQRGSSMCYDGNDTLYVARAIATTSFYSYSISGGTWSTLGVAPGTVDEGASITCLGDGDVYVLAGNNTANFYRFNGSWSTETNIPNTVYYGGGLTNDGTYLYALSGYFRGNYYRFEPGVGWTTLTMLPEGAYYNSVLKYDGDDSIYAFNANSEGNMWRYDITDDAWNRIADNPASTYRAPGIAVDTANSKMYVKRGNDTQSIYEFTFETDEYIPSATWISDTIDLDYVTSFTSFASNTTTPGSTSVSFYSRTSSNGGAWSDWAIISGGTISSPVNQYIQIKSVLTSDGTNSPTVSDFTINYGQDSVDPTNPTATGYDSIAKGTSIVDAGTYYYIQPYFELSGAVDAESGLNGYYVAWTTNGSLDPTSSEDYYQEDTTYQVNQELSSGTTYYLRVSTKDNAGNTSTSATLFTYVYNGISPASSATWDVQADFEGTGTDYTNVNTAADSGTNIKLSSVSGGVWTHEAPTPLTQERDSAIVYDGDDTIFYLRSVNTQNFYAYSISNKTYTALANYGSSVRYGSSMVYVPNGSHCADVDGCVFATRGNNQTTYQRYDVNANTWNTLAVVPGTVEYGSGIAWAENDYIYLTQGDNTRNFYRYSISGDSWTTLTQVEQTIRYGGTMEYVPNGTYCEDANGCLFVTRGNSDTDFYRYNISNNSWTYLANTPLWFQYGSASEYIDGYIYYNRGYVSEDFLRYDIANDFWEYMTDLPTTSYYGSSGKMVYVESRDLIYMLRGETEYTMLTYDVSDNEWTNTAMPRGISSYGPYYGAVSYDSTNNIMYAARGQSVSDFYAYDIDTGVWTRKADLPLRGRPGMDMEFINGEIYAITGESGLAENVGDFFKYDPATDMWERLSYAPWEFNYGSDLVWDGNDTIYAVRGANTRYFASYTISTDTWAQIGGSTEIPGGVYRGGCAVFGSNAGTDYVFVIRGENQDDIYAYDIVGGTWNSSLALAPGAMRYGDTCVNDGQGNLLVPRGDVTYGTDMYVYDISDDSWTTRNVLQYYEYGDLVMTSNNVVLGFRGENTSALERYVVATGTTGFETNGTWTSEILDFSADVYDFGGVEFTGSIANDTSLLIQTRTCADAGCASDPNDVNWDAWTTVTNTHTVGSTNTSTVASSIAQYGQVKLTFNSDQLYSPTVEKLDWHYYVDGTAPSNPSALTAESTMGGDSLTTDTWYGHDNPYFDWSGATDNVGGIGIEGYYVYFGTNALADPEVDGTLQSASELTASSLSTATTYYLRIKTKDYAGNVSSSTWAPFIYKLDNVAPARPTNITADPSVPTSTDSFDFSWTAGSDSGGSPTFNYCYMRWYDAGTYDVSETCIPSAQLSVLDMQALAEGVNTFRVRTKDEAGNYSNNGDWETVQYRYAVTPPSEVLSVQHGVVVGDDYSHTFSWNEPLTHAFDINSYCFQVNEQPTASYCNNETYGRWTTAGETSGRFLAAFRTPNTHPGTNYFYIVAKDEAGNVDWNESYDCGAGIGCVSFESTTVSPNPPQSFSIADASDRASSTYRLTLGWNEPAPNVGSVLYKYNIYRSEDDVSYTLRQSFFHDDAQSQYAYTDVGLDNTTTYYYKITAEDLAGAESSYTSTLSAKPEGKFTEPPSLIGTPTITPRIRSAVITWLTDDPENHPATSFVQFGTTPSLGDEQGNSDLVGEHEVTLVDLQPDTEYYIKLKWVDQDGNIGLSPQYTFETNGAPSAPTSLVATPATNTTNSFSFDWDAPVDEGVTIGGYYYSVNNIPNESNVTFVTDSAVGPIAAATQQGTNTFYVIAEDDVGNFNYNNYISTTFSINTPAPSTPTVISINDISVRATEDFALTVRWSGAGESTDHYNVYRSIDGVEYTFIAQTESSAYLDSGLETELTYYYKVTPEDDAGAVGEFSDVVSRQPTGRFITPPAYTSDPEVVVTSSTAVISWTTDRASSSFVNYGKTTDLEESKGSLEETVVHEVELTGLQPSTKYNFKAQSFDEARDYSLEEAQSDLFTFETSVAPAISDVKITDIRQTSALLTWKTTTVSSSIIKYGKTTDYGQEINDESTGATTVHTLRFDGLDSESLYHTRIFGTDIEGNELQSDDYVFQTLAFPRIFNLTFEPVEEASSATIKVNWETNVETDSALEFAADGGGFDESANTELVVEHEMILSDLLDDTAYEIRAKGRDQFGNIAVSDLIDYSTPFDTRPPKVSAVVVETAIIGVGDEASAQVIVSWKTDENATSQIEYGEGVGGDTYSNVTVEDATLTNSHVVIISDLQPSKPFHLRVVSRDGAANTTKSADYAVITGRATESVLDLIILNLQETFGWLAGLINILQ